MLQQILILIGLTFTPFVELRLSIPVGILQGSIHLPFGIELTGMGMNWLLVAGICIVSNIILGIILYHVFELLDSWLRRSFMKKAYIRFSNKSHKKIHKFVEKYGVLGVAVFIGLPVPGSGVYTGTLGAFLIGLDRKSFYKACVLGVFMAGTIVTLLTVTGMAIF